MILQKLLEGIETSNQLPVNMLGGDIQSIAFDSRQQNKDGLFVCLKGGQTDGSLFVQEAIQNGAVAFVSEKPLDDVKLLPVVLVKDARETLALLASSFFGKPANKLTMIGVTGTNGKTTTTNMIQKILEADKKIVGLIGTRGSYIGEKRLGGEMTTPDPVELYDTLSKMVKDGATHVVMEVSAHALALKKCAGISFSVSVFSNLTQDHLDFFETMENYGKAKEKLFSPQQSKIAVLNIDDEFGREIGMNAQIPVLTYGLDNPADCFAVDIQSTIAGTRYVANVCDDVFDVTINMPGMFNVYNSLAAITATSVLGITRKSIVRGLQNLAEVEGRFNVMELGKGAHVVIDFAHTPDGLEKILSSVRDLCKARMLVVFGCGGNRDRTKRPIMGQIAERYADFAVLTSDNPRYENPDLILDDIERGMQKDSHIKIVSRKEAIALALSIAKKGDVIVICGKGGETYQDINGVKVPYTDKEEVERYQLINNQ